MVTLTRHLLHEATTIGTGDKGGFASHECTSVHRRAVEVIEMLPRTICDIGELCLSGHANDKLQNRAYVLKVFQTIRYLSRQSLALRGDQESNFIQLINSVEQTIPSI